MGSRCMVLLCSYNVLQEDSIAEKVSDCSSSSYLPCRLVKERLQVVLRQEFQGVFQTSIRWRKHSVASTTAGLTTGVGGTAGRRERECTITDVRTAGMVDGATVTVHPSVVEDGRREICYFDD